MFINIKHLVSLPYNGKRPSGQSGHRIAVLPLRMDCKPGGPETNKFCFEKLYFVKIKFYMGGLTQP